MPPSSPLDATPIGPPHPLAVRLIERLRPQLPERIRVLDLAAGSGRNADALRNAGFEVVAIDDTAAEASPIVGLRGQFAGMVSTHGFLHGSGDAIAARVDAAARHLAPQSPIAVTFGSTNDRRFGRGTRIDGATYASDEGDERGVPHAFFTQAQVLALLEPAFDVESIEECAGDGKPDKVHWFVFACRR